MELETTTKVPVERLRLDRANPRLGVETAEASDERIIARLYRAAELDELLQSISTNGYLDIEPLVVMGDGDGGGLTVLEGNRRLATLWLLREPDLVSRVAAAEGTRIAVPEIDNAVRQTLNEVSVYLVANRERARAFIGFKHINGPQKWDAYAKARFAADWYRKGRADGIGLEQIAQAVGDRHDTIKRMVSAIYVLEQAREEGLYDIEDRYPPKFNFSHLYTALSRSQYMDYLGLEAAWSRHDPTPDQVPRDRLARLKHVLVWIYGSKTDDAAPVRLEFAILSLHPGLRHRCVAPDVWDQRVAGGGAAALVEEAGRHAGRRLGGAPRRAPAADGDAVAVEDPQAIGITARAGRREPDDAAGHVNLVLGEAEDLVLAPAGVVGKVEDVLPRGEQMGANGEVFGVLEEALAKRCRCLPERRKSKRSLWTAPRWAQPWDKRFSARWRARLPVQAHRAMP